MKNYIVFIICFFCSQPFLFSQVGINTETPNALLDIKSSSETTPLPTDGVLFPKADEFPTINPGANQDGMLLYITGDGSETKGFYFWNQATTTWEAVSGSGIGDEDWYVQGTTNAPTSINQSIFRNGRVSTGTNNYNFPAQFTSFSSGTLTTGLFSHQSINASEAINIYSRMVIESGGGIKRGVFNLLFGSNPSNASIRGIENNIDIEGLGPKTGIINYIAPSSSNSGVRRGIINIIGQANSGSTPVGVENEVYGNISAIGTQNLVYNTIPFANGIASQIIGTRNVLSGNPTTQVKGTLNIFNTASPETKTGIENSYTTNDPGEHQGMNNLFNSNNALSATGITSNFSGAGTGFKSGVQNIFTATSSGTNLGMENLFSSDNSTIQIGIANDFDGTGTGQKTGMANTFLNISSGTIYGTQNNFNSLNSTQATGISNSFSGISNQAIYGSRNQFNTTGSGDTYGAVTSINSSSTGFKWGNYIRIDPSAGGFHTGIYSEALKPGAFAGMFRGTVAIGSSLPTQYTLPLDRGTANQILQTNAAGVVSWVDNPATSPWQRSGTTVSLANTGDDITFSSQQTSVTFPPTSGSSPAMIHLFESGTNNADRMIFSQSPAFSSYGLMYRDLDDSFRFLRAGVDRVVINVGAVSTPLVVNGTAQASNFQSATTTYPDYVFESYFNGTSNIRPDYRFLSLNEIAQFISENGHLPGVTSYKEVKANNMQFNLTETSIKNLEKIEELFLHIIELNNENKTLKKENEILKKQQEDILKRLRALEQK